MRLTSDQWQRLVTGIRVAVRFQVITAEIAATPGVSSKQLWELCKVADWRMLGCEFDECLWALSETGRYRVTNQCWWLAQPAPLFVEKRTKRAPKEDPRQTNLFGVNK